MAQSEQKADAKFVSKDEYHALDKTLVTRNEFNARMIALEKRVEDGFAQLRGEMSQLRAEFHNINRIGIGLLGGIFALVATLVAGIVIGA